jgi:DNA helicase-2/ATP-dependent DNA helicase PcrA
MMEEFGLRCRKGALAAAAREIVAKVGYREELERCYKTANEVEARWQSVEELINAIAQYEERSDRPSLTGFLEEIALATREDQNDEPSEGHTEHAVSLMTLHSAKGLEFPHVYMVGMEEGLLPHKRSVVDSHGIDEERRLCYVGVTRAQESLTLTLCKARMKWGKAQPAIPSRFIMEMKGDTDRARRAAEAAAEQVREAERAAVRAAKKRSGPSQRAATRRRPARKGA